MKIFEVTKKLYTQIFKTKNKQKISLNSIRNEYKFEVKDENHLLDINHILEKS